MAAQGSVNPTGIVSFDHHQMAGLPEYWQVSRAVRRLRRALLDAKIDLSRDEWLQVLNDMECALYFVDGCPECVVGREAPYAADVADGGVAGAYRCARCGHTWTCNWSTRAPLIDFGDGAA